MDTLSEGSVRRAGVDDVAAMVSLYWQDGGDVGDQPAAAARWAYYQSQAPSTVAHDGDRVVGFALGERMSKDLLVLSNILVAADCRSRGIGAALASRLLAEGAADGYAVALVANSTLYERSGKRSADAFYRRLGFDVLLTTGPTVLYRRSI